MKNFFFSDFQLSVSFQISENKCGKKPDDSFVTSTPLPPCAFYPTRKQNIQLKKTEKIKMCDHPFFSIYFSTTYVYDLCTDWNFVTFSSLHRGLHPGLFSCPLLHVWHCKLGCGVEGMGVLAAWDTRRKMPLHEAAGGYGWGLFKEMSAQHSTRSLVPQTNPSS